MRQTTSEYNNHKSRTFAFELIHIATESQENILFALWGLSVNIVTACKRYFVATILVSRGDRTIISWQAPEITFWTSGSGENNGLCVFLDSAGTIVKLKKQLCFNFVFR